MKHLPNSLNQQREHFKAWIKKRFIAETDFCHLSAIDALAWSAALKELSDQVTHQIVPFHHRGQ